MRPTRAAMTKPKSGQDATFPLFQFLAPSLPAISAMNAPRRLLKPASHRQPGVLAVDFVDGCGETRAFWHTHHAADSLRQTELRLYRNAAEQLDEELAQMEMRPSAVVVSPGIDPYLPLGPVQSASARIAELLARQGIDALFMTRGYIRPAALEVLRRHRKHLKVVVGITTLDRSLQRQLEPLAAPPRLRLKNIRQLQDAGIACQVALEPLIPGLTDTRDNLLPLLQELAEAGVRQISVGYLVLTSKAERDLQAALHKSGWDSLVFEEYASARLIRPADGAAGRYLPRSRRQHGYAAVMAMGAGLGIRVKVNALTNPDFTPAAPAPINRVASRMQATAAVSGASGAF
jgi:DNA repair photolyase